MRDAVAEGLAQALLDPVPRIEVVRVAQHHEQHAVGGAQRGAAAPRGVGKRYGVERRLRGAHLVERDGGNSQRLGQQFDVFDFGRHLMLPASSKIGMYISTTTTPTDTPSTALRIRSEARGEPSPDRAP